MTTRCPKCGREIEADDDWIGSGVECPHCNKEITLPPGITTCPSCRADVSTEAASCPHCGHQFRELGSINTKDPVHVIGIILIVIIVLSILFYILQFV
jgi:DNA-directed RNA polymerase subunit RPC12/RpoP